MRSTSVRPSSGDLVQPPGEPGQRAGLRFEPAPAQVLEQVVVRVDAIECRRGRVDLVEVPQVVVDEMMQRFG